MHYTMTCRRGCGTTFSYQHGDMRAAARWQAEHRCGRLPESYHPRHLKITTKEKTAWA